VEDVRIRAQSSLMDIDPTAYAVAVVDVDAYESEEPRERDDGIEWRLRFRSGTYEGARENDRRGRVPRGNQGSRTELHVGRQFR